MLTKNNVAFAAIMFLWPLLHAQTTEQIFEISHQRGMDFVKKKTSEELRTYYQQKSRKPSQEQLTKLRQQLPANEMCQVNTQKAVSLPENRWFPGEFEEVQAILITWEYFHVDDTYQYFVDPVNDTLAYYFQGEQIKLVPYVSIIDTTNSTRIPVIMAQIADAVQQGGAQVWINICNAEDSLIIKKYMTNKGMPLQNYRFFVNTINAIWFRDYGPNAFYYGADDSIAFLDLEYYGGRPMDDVIPIKIGQACNIPVYTTGIEFEGGNILVDGAGTLFTSNQLYYENQDRYGQMYINELGNLVYRSKSKLSVQEIDDSLKYLFALTNLEVMQALRFDGGTGHIDLYAAMWDENNFVFTKYPSEISNLTDYTISMQNVDSILHLYSYHGKKYRGRNIPLPKKDDDTWYKNNMDYVEYTRTYSNSTFVNDVIIQPIFSDDSWGARAWDLKAIDLMKKQFPGYTLIPIDIRGHKDSLYTGFDGTGGAIHCITKQIPAENPIRILHPAIQGFANEYNGTFPIQATITNKSGIESASCFWRVKGQSNWNEISMINDHENIFVAEIIRDANVLHDTIEYYISATSNNGKTITKPLTAPKGFYWFYHGTDAIAEIPEDIYQVLGINYHNVLTSSLVFENLYPNPANDKTHLLVSNEHSSNVQLKVLNILGQMVYENSFKLDDTITIIQLQTSSFSNGLYHVVISDNNGNQRVKKLMIQH